ncbi:ComF family protein [Cupriavidus plantarum]|uniref:ComF family protein n=2 Tax=Cupriavidus plantarum TaxID=942865 RepID=A0A316F132_9BURK|nr:ComF family protein [Cupriavidus plantarum]
MCRTLLPSACALCGRVQAEVVCTACVTEHFAPEPRCPLCALRSPRGRRCLPCRADPPPIDAALTLGDYAPPLDALVLALKRGVALPHARWFAEALADRLADPHAGTPLARPAASYRPWPDLLIPIPLARERLATRGFNQAWEIARPLGRRLGIPSDATVLARRGDAAMQHLLNLNDRLANVQGAFVVTRPAAIEGRHIGIVDDVMTTGATLREAAYVLKAHGAVRVTVLCALRTP